MLKKNFNELLCNISFNQAMDLFDKSCYLEIFERLIRKCSEYQVARSTLLIYCNSADRIRDASSCVFTTQKQVKLQTGLDETLLYSIFNDDNMAYPSQRPTYLCHKKLFWFFCALLDLGSHKRSTFASVSKYGSGF